MYFVPTSDIIKIETVGAERYKDFDDFLATDPERSNIFNKLYKAKPDTLEKQLKVVAELLKELEPHTLFFVYDDDGITIERVTISLNPTHPEEEDEKTCRKILEQFITEELNDDFIRENTVS